jgi:NADP-dependent 3-hydroxy acid dehydrogenase YdfG
LPDRLEFSPSDDHVFLVVNDGSELTTKVIGELQLKGWSRIAILNFPATCIPQNIDPSVSVLSIEMAELSEQAIQEALQKIKQQLGTIDSAIYLIPQLPTSKSELFTSSLPEQVLKYLFFVSKYLQPELTQNRFKGNERHNFLIVTHMDGQLGLRGDQWYDPIQGGYYGLLKTINVEWESVFTRIIDLSSALSTQEQASHISSELLDPALNLVEVGYSANCRYTIGTVKKNHPILNSQTGLDISPSDVFVVPGGGKGVTASCVIEMAKKFKNKFVLIGRSEIFLEEPVWAVDCFEINLLKKNYINFLIAKGEKPVPKIVEATVSGILSSREISSTIQKVKSSGSQVFYYAADITDLVMMQQTVGKVQNQIGPVTGVLHGAGVLADKQLHKKTESDYDHVYQTKIKGLQVILKTIDIQQLKHLVLFSSAAGFYGNEAQSDYALANEILNKTSHLIKQLNPNCHVISANWGPWDMGMVTPQLKKLFNERNIKVIPESVGTEILCNELSNLNKNLTQIVIGSSMVTPVQPDQTKQVVVKRSIDLKSNPTIIDHVIGGEAVLPIVFALSWIADSCLNQYPGYRFYQCRNMQVLKGIIFKQDDPGDYHMEITQLTTTNIETIDLSVSVNSRGKGRLPVFHYKCELTLKKRVEPAPVHFLSTAMEDTAIKNPAFYEDGTLFHGSSLQGIKTVLAIDDQIMLLNCRNSAISFKQQGQFPINAMNHYVADVMLQSVVVWARKQYGVASLPLKITDGIFYKPVPFEQNYIIEVEITVKSSVKVISNIKCVDQQGSIYMKLSGIEITLSKNLNQKFLENQLK